jgi:hypothetical protein
MTYQVFCQVFPAGSWKWTSKDPAGVGMRLDGAFRAFATTVNALPGNAGTPLSVVRSHADATANGVRQYRMRCKRTVFDLDNAC